jgi:hypothetical protein
MISDRFCNSSRQAHCNCRCRWVSRFSTFAHMICCIILLPFVSHIICWFHRSGKTSLVSALLREMNCLKGSVHIGGTIAYAAQQPWLVHAISPTTIPSLHSFSSLFFCCFEMVNRIVNRTLRDNILFDVTTPNEEQYVSCYLVLSLLVCSICDGIAITMWWRHAHWLLISSNSQQAIKRLVCPISHPLDSTASCGGAWLVLVLVLVDRKLVSVVSI